MPNKPKVAVLYCGSSLTRSLIDNLIQLGVNPIMMPSHVSLQDIQSFNPIAIIIGGSPFYINSHDAPGVDPALWTCGIPILGICYGMQLMARDLGGVVKRMAGPELELVHLDLVNQESTLFRDFTDEGAPVWMLHTCKVTEVPAGFVVTAETEDTQFAAMECPERNLYAVQFHPEHKGKDPSSQAGTAIIWSFLNGICGHSLVH